MSYVAINVLTVPEGAGVTLEERFAARQGSVDTAAGFEHFELLRPVEGTSDYLVYTRWASEADFTAWRDSQSFSRGHADASGRPQSAPPAATGSTIWAFEIAQQSSGSTPGVGATQPQPPAHEHVPGIVTTDPGPQQVPGQGAQAPEEQGTRGPEDPAGEPGFA